MKNMYTSVLSRWLFMLLLLSSQTLLAQTAPTIQWQKVVPVGNNPGPLASRVTVIKNGTAGYLVSSSDRRLLSLNSNGDITSDTPIIGLFADGSTSPSLGVLDMAMTNDANVVLAVQDNAGTSVQKRTTSGSVLWNNRLFPYSNDYYYTTTRLVANPDGSIVCFATYMDRTVLPAKQYVVGVKLNSDGTQQWRKSINYPGATATIVERAIAGNDGRYILVGNTYAPSDNNTFFRGWVATISESGDVVWQRRYDEINGLNTIAPFGDTGKAYVINGPLSNNPGGTYTASSIVIDDSGNINTSFPIGVIPDPAFNSLATLTAVPNTNRPVVYVQAFDTPTSVRGGDMQLTAFSSENRIIWSKTVGGSGRDYNFGPSIVATANGFIVAGITESTDGDVQGKQTNLPATWIVKLDDPSKRLMLTQPSYNCMTGAITFNTTGGDGSAITFSAPGIMRSSATSNSGTVEQGLRNDPKPITITATQSGQSITYSFDLKAACTGTTPTPTPTPTPNPPTTGGTLTLTQPTYNCSTGAITFNSTGGDGSPITFSAPGITRSSPSSFTGTVEQGLRNDPKVITITGTQSGYSTSYSFDLKAFCGGTPPLVAPALLSPIPDQTRIAGKQLTNDTISISRFFGGVGNYPNFRPVLLFLTTGLPPGMTIFNNSTENRTSAYIGGTPTTPGVYVVTVSAFISNSTSGAVPTTTTKFQITILDSSTPTPPPTTGGTLTLMQPTYNCSTGAITFNTTGGNGTPISYTAPGITRSSVTSNTGTVEQGLRNDPKTITITATQSGYSTSYSFDLKAFCNATTPGTSTLKLLTPIVDCSLRQVTLVTSGGDGSAITFNTPTITRSSATSSVGIVDLCVGAKPPVLQATQSGFTTTYESFDFAKQCPAFLSVKPLMASQIPDITLPGPDYRVTLGNYFRTETNSINRYAPSFKFQLSGAPDGSSIDDQSSVVRSLQPYAFLTLNISTPGVYTVTVTGRNECEPAASSTFKVTVNPTSGTTPLTLTQPTYDCSTGAFTFNFTGGNGSPVEFQAAGITGWTTNRNQFVDKDSRTASDVKPFTLMARQNGQVVTYTWDLKAACGRSARMAATESGQTLELTVKGNPVGNTAVVEIRGVEGEAIQLDLLNASGHVLEQRHIEQAGAVDEQRFDLQRQPTGLLFLRAQSGQQKQTVKLIKQ